MVESFSREKLRQAPQKEGGWKILCYLLPVLLLLLFLTFSVLVANPKKLLYTVANPARGLLNREKRTKEKVWRPRLVRPLKSRMNGKKTHNKRINGKLMTIMPSHIIANNTNSLLLYIWPFRPAAVRFNVM